jgi:universal stress protein A
MSYQRVLVPIDFSDDSLHALNTAAAGLAHTRGTLVLLHVIEQALADETGPAHAMSRGRMQAVSRAEITAGEAPPSDAAALRLTQLKSLAAPHVAVWKQVEVRVRQGQATEDIIEAAQADAIDLVVMGSHGSGGLGKMLFGSTTYDVARKLRCSVLISKRPA